jgi:hypothetical protein
VADLDSHYTEVVEEIVAGRVTPFLGAGINLAGRPSGSGWEQGKFLPSGLELAQALATEFHYPRSEHEQPDLLRIAQYVSIARGSGPLYLKLRSVFDDDYPPTEVQEFFATLPRLVREKGYSFAPQLLVTTNYDDSLERAFLAAKEPYDLVWYMADGEPKGLFWQWPHDGEPEPILNPAECHDLSTERRTVILKVHGAVDRRDRERDSFVITEDHYIDYLTRTEISRVPVMLAQTLKWSHFLFLGYSMRDWNFRVLMHRIWGEQKLKFGSWSVQLEATEIDKKLWDKRGDVEILDLQLSEYIGELRKRIEALPPAPAGRQALQVSR